MSLSIYLDDCAFSYRLRQLLQESGYQVQIPADVQPSLIGAHDNVHFVHACKIGFILLTYNPGDFLRLHLQQPDHPGILAVYQDNVPGKDMTFVEIVSAINNLLQTEVTISGGFWVLNAYRW